MAYVFKNGVTQSRRLMEKYENLGLVGEGSYGMVLKCKHKETGAHVAIKKFLESEDDKMVKKIAMREVKMLKTLRHENLVNLIEVFRRKKRLYLVFEFVDHTVLDDLERCPNGLDTDSVRKVLWQTLKGIEFCHLHNIIHRDIKPENILISKNGVVKLCDFGFARTLAQPGEAYTDYVATRWYRAPELLVGDTKYGRAVDIWAIGCLMAEMLTGDPLFPGDSDIDQLYLIVRTLGNLTARHREIFHKNPLFVGMRLPETREVETLDKKFPRMSSDVLDIQKQCMRLEANERPTCSTLLRHDFFTSDDFSRRFPSELKAKIAKESDSNPLLVKIRAATSKDSSDDKDSKENSNKRKRKDHIKDKYTIDRTDKSTSKDEDFDKGRRKDGDKTKKLSPAEASHLAPPGHRSSQGNDERTSVNGSVAVDKRESDVTLAAASPSGMPPIQTTAGSISRNYRSVSDENLWTNEEKKKSKTKKVAPANHHSMLLGQPGLQSEKTSLHEKSKKKSKETLLSHAPDGFMLPHVRGAEANPNKPSHKMMKKSQLPQITTLDPFASEYQHGSPDPDRDSNLPHV